jgi:hypothetical protein
MSRFAFKARILAGGAAALATAFLMAAAAAQTPASPPDFSSNQTAWQTPNGTDYIAIPGTPPLIANDPAHPYISNGIAVRTGQQPTYRIADLSNPNLKQWAKDVMKKDNDEVLKGKIGFTPSSSCKQPGVPASWLAGGPFFFIQTANEVMIIEEGDRHARRIRMTGPHSANPKPSWYGESVGHYEDDTLVVDTIGFNTKTFVDNYRTPHSDKLHVVERYRLIQDGKTLEVRFTVEDPETFNQPWSAVRRFNKTQATLGEEICQEGNFNLFDYGIPVAKTPDF